MRNKFAERFKELLESNKLTQAEFARSFGFHFNTVNSWCVGKSHPHYDILIKICKEFHETSDYLLGLAD